MKTVYVCGKRGLGDIVCGISNILNTIQEDVHLLFMYPPNYDYENRIPTILKHFVPTQYNVSYEVVTNDWYSVNPRIAEKKFEHLELNKDWYFTESIGGGPLREFKILWKKDLEGPIGLCLNNENTNDTYPMKGKWFDEKFNKHLESLIDEKKYVAFGRMFSIDECIEKLSRCRYVVGVDGAWAHICNAMRVPYYLSLNKYPEIHYESFFRNHPTLIYVREEEVFNLMIL